MNKDQGKDYQKKKVYESRARELVAIDYAHKLSKSELDFLDRFNDAVAGNNWRQHLDDLPGIDEMGKAIDAAVNARNRDAQSLAAATGNLLPTTPGDLNGVASEYFEPPDMAASLVEKGLATVLSDILTDSEADLAVAFDLVNHELETVRRVLNNHAMRSLAAVLRQTKHERVEKEKERRRAARLRASARKVDKEKAAAKLKRQLRRAKKRIKIKEGSK